MPLDAKLTTEASKILKLTTLPLHHYTPHRREEEEHPLALLRVWATASLLWLPTPTRIHSNQERCLDNLDFPGGSVVKNMLANVGDESSIPGFRKIPWGRKWQPTWEVLPGESHGQRSLAGYRSWGYRVGHDLATKQQQQTQQKWYTLLSAIRGWGNRPRAGRLVN